MLRARCPASASPQPLRTKAAPNFAQGPGSGVGVQSLTEFRGSGVGLHKKREAGDSTFHFA